MIHRSPLLLHLLHSPPPPPPPSQVSMLVRDQLIERARDFYIILDDVSLVSPLPLSLPLWSCCREFLSFPTHRQTDLSFGREYTAAVEAKQVGTYYI